MTGILAAYAITFAAFIILAIYAYGWKHQLDEYRKEAAVSEFEARLMKNGGSIRKY